MDWSLIKSVAVVIGVFAGLLVMVGLIGAGIEAVVKRALAAIGVNVDVAKWAKVFVFSAVVVYWSARIFGDAGVEKTPEGQQPAELVTSRLAGQENAAAVDCSCASGATCKGPRGGQYCLTGDGNKRYK